MKNASFTDRLHLRARRSGRVLSETSIKSMFSKTAASSIPIRPERQMRSKENAAIEIMLES